MQTITTVGLLRPNEAKFSRWYNATYSGACSGACRWLGSLNALSSYPGQMIYAVSLQVRDDVDHYRLDWRSFRR
jgi:hypothetical protein